jgi:hypothetical protein
MNQFSLRTILKGTWNRYFSNFSSSWQMTIASMHSSNKTVTAHIAMAPVNILRNKSGNRINSSGM